MVRKCRGDVECKTRPSFNHVGESKPIYCFYHKMDEMVNLLLRSCIEEGCNTSPNYNTLSERVPIYCGKHKKNGMINVTAKVCLEKECFKQPKYNIKGEKYGLYCVEHKKDKMIDVKSKRCIESECDTIPIYNYQTEKCGLFCSKHKKENMINVMERRVCAFQECNKIPVFNYQNEQMGVYCKIHKEDGMINIVSDICNESGCKIQANFNFPDKKNGLKCSKHKFDGMIDVKNRKCIESNCNVSPNYNTPEQTYGIRCAKHKQEGMVNVTSNKCKNNCGTTAKINKYKGYCLRCFLYLFPNEKVSRYYKIREQHFVDFLLENFKEIVFTFDKTVNGCSKRRPDAYIDLYTHILVLENDENQHKRCEEICENKRTMELFQDFANRPIVFIRFNPDNYTDENGKKHMSSFKYHSKLDVPVLRNKKEWENRLKVLKQIVDKWLVQIPDSEVTIEYLFYDC